MTPLLLLLLLVTTASPLTAGLGYNLHLQPDTRHYTDCAFSLGRFPARPALPPLPRGSWGRRAGVIEIPLRDRRYTIQMY